MDPVEKKPVIIIIDDDRGPRESMKYVLEPDYIPYTAASVDEGLTLLDSLSPDCIILDIRMPGRDGIEGLEEIRKRNARVPVIMCTAYASLDTAQQAIRLEANDYIRKPFKAQELIAAVKKQVSRYKLLTVHETVVQGVQDIEGKLAGELGEVGMAASALVHDLRNPLTSVLTSVYLLDKELKNKVGGATSEPSEAVQEYLQIINKNLENCRELTGSWKSITNTHAMKWEQINMEEIVDHVFSQQPVDRHDLKRNMVKRGPQNEILITADRNQLQRLLFNLVQNAVEVTDPEQGEINVEWSYEDEEVHLYVHDNGVGIDPEKKARILEPFFTDGKLGGSGLGLFIVKRITELHEGRLEIISAPGEGATFKVSLPLTHQGSSLVVS